MPKAKQTQAWLLPISANLKLLVPLTCSQELLEQVELIQIPSARDDCCGLLSWRDYLLPVLDLNKTFAQSAQKSTGNYAQVVAAQDATGAIDFVALQLAAAPEVVTISDKMNYPLPSALSAYASLLPAAVMLDQQVVAVLNIQQLLAG